jgi:type III pantothenate kinase
VREQLDAIAAAIDAIAVRMHKGGRLVYCGAGTSGRLGVLDATECPPTFGTPPELVVGVIAGGLQALTRAVEGAEDRPELAVADLEGIVVSSGVPRVTATLREIAERHLDFDPIVIEPGVRTGIRIDYDNPKEVGADRIANAIGAFDIYGGPTIIADFGTATTCDAVSADGVYLGGAIAPGIEVSMDALVGRAAALRAVELRAPRSVLGKSTVESIQSGAVYGFAAQVDGLCDRIEVEIGSCTVISTGGLAELITPFSARIEHIEPWVTLHGLRLVYEKNV